MSRVERHEREKLSEKEVTEIPSHDKAPNLTNCKESKSLSVKESKQSRSKPAKRKPAKRKQSKYKEGDTSVCIVFLKTLIDFLLPIKFNTTILTR